MKLAFIGGGVMAEAILTGVLRDGVSAPPRSPSPTSLRPGWHELASATASP